MGMRSGRDHVPVLSSFLDRADVRLLCQSEAASSGRQPLSGVWKNSLELQPVALSVPSPFAGLIASDSPDSLRDRVEFSGLPLSPPAPAERHESLPGDDPEIASLQLEQHGPS